jgi:hypothetical protein
MSVVLGVTLICSSIDEALASEFDASLKRIHSHWDIGRDLAGDGGGDKHPQNAVHAFGLNYGHLKEEQIVTAFQALPWEAPENAVLVLQPEDGISRIVRPGPWLLDRYPMTLHEAAGNGEKTVLARLLAEGVEVDCRNGVGQTPLMLAAVRGEAGAVRLLLEHGADPTARESEHGRTALFYADNLDCLKLLLHHGSDPDMRDKNCLPALYWPRWFGRSLRPARM